MAFRCGVLTLAFFLVFCLAWSGTSHAGGVAILSTVLEDNGDHDSFADTRETVLLRLLVRNTSGGALSDLTLALQAVGPGRACVTDGTLVVGDLAAGEIRLTEEAFELVVGDLDRTALGLGSFDPFSQALLLSSPSHPSLSIDAEEIVLDLDLNVSGGAGQTFFFESFEDDLGAFEIDNLDASLSNLEDVDGYRCQYYDPANPNNNNATLPPGEDTGEEFCYLGVSDMHADQVFWQRSGPGISQDNGRGFDAFHSLFFGIDLGAPGLFTTPMATMEAARTSEPIHLAWDDVSPTLTFKHQASFADDTFGNVPQGETWDRGVVMVQVADEAGNPVGPWYKIFPSINVYDARGSDNFFGCMFDPIDDGSDEEDFFNPYDPEHRFGPSSTCMPALTFARMGETSEPWNPANVGRADGPGLQGLWGIGTWIESSFDLSRFRGRSIRLRFLVSALKYGLPANWDEFFPNANPDPSDDGWWIDAVEISNVLTTAAVVENDDADNSALPVPVDGDLDSVFDGCDNCVADVNPDQADADVDGNGDVCDVCPGEAYATDDDLDGVCSADNCPDTVNPDQANADGDPAGAACDCDDTNPAIFPDAVEVNDGIDNQCPGDEGYGTTDEITGLAGFFFPNNKNIFSWPAQEGASTYHVARGETPGYSVGCTLFVTALLPRLLDTTPVPPGGVYYYLVRAALPNEGSWGLDSAGVERIVPCAP